MPATLSEARALYSAGVRSVSEAMRAVLVEGADKLNLGVAWDLAARTRLSGAFSAVGEQVLDNDEPNTLGRRIPAYYLVELKLAQGFGWGRLAATINNLFDEGRELVSCN